MRRAAGRPRLTSSSGYDLNNWIETAQSKALKATLAPDDVLIEGQFLDTVAQLTRAGYPSHPTHRLALTSLYPPTAHTPPSITLDGVGGCTTLVLASIHREGAIFPSWPVDHQIETEGFAQIVKRLGGRMIGLTGVFVYHGTYCFPCDGRAHSEQVFMDSNCRARNTAPRCRMPSYLHACLRALASRRRERSIAATREICPCSGTGSRDDPWPCAL